MSMLGGLNFSKVIRIIVNNGMVENFIFLMDVAIGLTNAFCSIVYGRAFCPDQPFLNNKYDLI